MRSDHLVLQLDFTKSAGFGKGLFTKKTKHNQCHVVRHWALPPPN